MAIITNFSEFEEAFPNYSFLESLDGCTRYSNGEEPDSEYESAWFDDETEELVNSPRAYNHG
ncbi:MAG: hypothetical protein MI864_25945 [Pseudomonadales bacterium]|nr:hypothetical protein [Pseudomonadales bacterium]